MSRLAGDPTIPYGMMSYWQDTAPAWSRSRSDLQASRYDVVVVGGGFTGLWTAYHLKRRSPSLTVAVLERHEIGFGASGRNGGFAMTKFGHSLAQMVRDYGVDRVRALHLAAEAAVDGLATTAEAESIDCELDYGGLLVVATNAAQERRLRRDAEAAAAIGLTGARLLDRRELREIVDSPTYSLGFSEHHCAVLHPGKLVRGLASVVEGLGVDLIERADLLHLEPGSKPRLQTSVGVITADQVVLATNAWASEQKQFDRKVMPIYSYIIVTEPISEATWDQIGWSDRQGIEDKREHLHYCRRTRDGRLLLGGNYNMNTWASRIAPRYDRNPKVFEALYSHLTKTFPPLSRIKVSHGWGGPIAMTPNFLPSFGSLSPTVHFGHGYNGHGVAPSFLGGEILTDLLLGEDSARRDLMIVGGDVPGAFPREPIRFVGARLALREALWYDEVAESGRSLDSEPRLLRFATKVLGKGWR